MQIIELLTLLSEAGKPVLVSSLPWRVQKRDERHLRLHNIEIHTIRTACQPRPQRWIGFKMHEWPEPVCNLEVVLAALPGRPVTLARELDIEYNALYRVLKELESLGKARKEGRQWINTITSNTDQSGRDS